MERILRVKNWVKTKINPKTLVGQKFRDLIMNNITSSTFGEICAYRLLCQDVKGGELPSYVPEVLIVSMSMLEAIVTPFLSWFWFSKRRFLLLFYTTVALLSAYMLYFIPSATIREESEFCDAANLDNDISYQGMSVRSIVRLTIIMTAVLAFQLSRVTTWSHGLGYYDEYLPERITLAYGSLLLGRVIVLAVGNKLLGGLVDRLLPLKVTIMVVGYIVNLIQFMCAIPEHAPVVKGVQKTALPLDNRGFSLSISRVVSRLEVVALALSSSLLVAALWGAGYNREDIVRVKFLMPESSSSSNVLILQYVFVIMPIALAGVKFSTPIVLEYCKKSGLTQTILMTVFAFVFFLLFTLLPRCDQGSVAGLEDHYYNHPDCSLSCGCKPRWGEFNPVCVTDSMTTFLSPCNAGCSSSENVNGIQSTNSCPICRVYRGCRCAGPGAVLPGACATDCQQQYILHDMLFIVVTTFIMLALQAQGVHILKMVDPRDKSVAMGFLLAMVAFVSFVCGHLIFTAIRATTCRWYEGGKCHLQSALFPYLVGFCSSFLVLLSGLISITIIVISRNQDKKLPSVTSL